MNKVKILFLAADPSDSTRLRLGQELRDIRENLQRSKERDKILLESRESVRPGDITQAILDIKPQIVHFSGHGTSLGEICIENIQGQTQLLKPEALASLFELELIHEDVECVVLNNCYSETPAKAISKYIPFVIGMNQAIGDRAAITFAVGFYKTLGAGHSIEDAYNLACVEIQLAGIEEHLTPILYTNKDIVIQGKISNIPKISQVKKYPENIETNDSKILFLSKRIIQIGSRTYQIHQISDIQRLKIPPDTLDESTLAFLGLLCFLFFHADNWFAKIIACCFMLIILYGFYQMITAKPSYAMEIKTNSGSQLVRSYDRNFIDELIEKTREFMDGNTSESRYIFNLKNSSIQIQEYR